MQTRNQAKRKRELAAEHQSAELELFRQLFLTIHPRFEVEYQPSQHLSMIAPEDAPIPGRVYAVRISGEQCLQFGFLEHTNRPSEMIIMALDNCTPQNDSTIGSGTFILRACTRFVSGLNSTGIPKYVGCSLVIQIDVSALFVRGIRISLRALYLLTTGESWYNANGFYEPRYHENVIKTMEYIQRPYTLCAPKGTRLPREIPVGVRATRQSVFRAVFARIKTLSKELKEYTLGATETDALVELTYYAALVNGEDTELRDLLGGFNKFAFLEYSSDPPK